MSIQPVTQNPDAEPVPMPPAPQDLPEGETDDVAAKPLQPPRGERRTNVRAQTPPTPRSSELASVRANENAALRDIINELGERGSYTISVRRTEPEQVRDNHNKTIRTAGHLKTYEEPVDEEFLAKKHGGGKYQLIFKNKNGQGRFVHFTSRTVEIAGDPDLTDPCLNLPPPANAPVQVIAPAQPGENPQLVKTAFDVLTNQLDRVQNQPRHIVEQPRTPDPSIERMFLMLQEQIKTQTTQMAELQRQLLEARTTKPPEDPFRDRMLDTLLKDDSARIQQLRAQYESEIRTTREIHIADERRLRDQFDRDKQDVRQSHERELAALRASHEIQLQAAKHSFDTSKEITAAENKRVMRDNDDLRVEVRELRAKKEKSLPEQIKEIEAVKDLIGSDDGEKSTVDKIMEVLPGTLEAAKSYFKPDPPAQQQQQATSGGTGGAITPKRKVFQTPDGQRWMLDGKGNLLPVVKKKPEPKVNEETGMPEIDPERVKTITEYLERAFSNNTDPEVLAQSSRSMVPEEILAAIRDHGVDPFLSKVAKLPSTSPLMNQAGKNWVRKVAKALVGD